MFERVHYDPENDIIWADMSNYTLSETSTQKLHTAVKQIIATLPEKPYMAICIENMVLPPEYKEGYSKAATELAALVKLIIPYGRTSFLTKLGVQTENIAKGRPTNFCASKEEALAAILAAKAQTSSPHE
jgi:hypothetical protein